MFKQRVLKTWWALWYWKEWEECAASIFRVTDTSSVAEEVVGKQRN
jgi:hypothetical protein